MAKQKKTNRHVPKYIHIAPAAAYIAAFFVLAIFTFHPINYGNNYIIETTKQRTFFILLALSLVACGGVLFYQLTQGYKFKKTSLSAVFRGIRPYEYALLAYWCVLLLSALLSPYPQYVMQGYTQRSEGFLTQTCYIVAFFFVARFYKPCMRDMLIFCATAAIVAALGILQYYGLSPIRTQANAGVGPALLLVSTMSNRNILSTYLTLAFFVSLVCFLQKEKRWHWSFLPCLFAIFYMLLLGDTESGYFGILFAGGFCFALYVRDKFSAARFFAFLSGCACLMLVHAHTYPALAKANGMTFPPLSIAAFVPALPFIAVAMALLAALFFFAKLPALPPKGWRRGWLVALVLLLVLFAVFLPVIAEKSAIPSLQQLSEISRGNVDDSFMSYRAFAWRHALKLSSQRPLFGFGPDAFGIAFKEQFAQASVEQTGALFDKVHNEYLQTLVDEGWLGLLTLLAFYMLLFWSARKHLHKTLPLALFTAMLCFAGQAFFNFSTPIAHPVVWTMWGVFAASCRKSAAA